MTTPKICMLFRCTRKPDATFIVSLLDVTNGKRLDGDTVAVCLKHRRQLRAGGSLEPTYYEMIGEASRVV